MSKEKIIFFAVTVFAGVVAGIVTAKLSKKFPAVVA